MEKLDLTRLYKSYYTAKAKPVLLTVAPASYLSLLGQGDPSGEAYAENIQALYTVAYAVKFAQKAKDKDFVVPKLEGLWWFDEQQFPGHTMEDAPREVPREDWQYRMLLRLPDYVTEQDIAAAIDIVVEKKQLTLARKTEYYRMDEGAVVQVLHTGPFEKEPETLSLLWQFMKEQQLQRNGVHHEIYLSDFRKTAPDKLKTILREPVCRKGKA
jgi:hypothetical protein